MGGCLTTLCSPIRAERELETAAHPERGTHEVGGCLTTLCSPIRAERELEMAAHPERGTHEVGGNRK